MNGLLWVDSAAAPWSFILVTLLLGGLAAFTAGRALAQTWRPFPLVFVSAALLACAAGFLHYALFGEAAISIARIAAVFAQSGAAPASRFIDLAFALRHYAVIFITLSAFAACSFQWARARSMSRQYGFE